MKETLIIFLNAVPERVHWIILNADKTIKTLELDTDASLLASIAEDKEIFVIIPTETISLFTVKMPPLSRARLIEALPYALEDQLTAELNDLHFALGAIEKNVPCEVAVIAKGKMDEWMALFSTWHIKPSHLVPDIYTLSIEKEVWHIAKVNDRLLVRLNDYQGFSIDQAHSDFILNSLYKDSEFTHPKTIMVSLIENQSTFKLSFLEGQVHSRKITLKDWLAESAYQLTQKPYIDLLQGHYRAKKQSRINTNKLKKVNIGLGICFLFLILLMPGISYVMLKGKSKELELAMQAIFHKHFSANEKMISPKIKLEKKLKVLTSGSETDKVYQLLFDISHAKLNSPAIEIKQITYQNNHMMMQFEANSSNDYTKFTNDLRNQNVLVKEDNVNLDGTRMLATISLG